MNSKNTILCVGVTLIALGLLQPNLASLGVNNSSTSNVVNIIDPTDPDIKAQAEDVLKIIKEAGQPARADARKLRDLYLDIARLVSLDGEDEVIKSTEEIRQANSIAGVMLKLDIKGKYPNLAKELKEVVVSAIGDDQILLSKELREKAVSSFNAIAWALNEGSK